MGSSSGGKRRYMTFRNKHRANMSFFIVIMFFAVFGIIVFTEIFLIDERGRGAGVLVRHGSISYHHRQERPDYEDALQDTNQDQAFSESQLPPFPANTTPLDGNWQAVNGTRFKFFVFSAFLDTRKGQKAVRVIGATKTRGADRVWCRLWFRASEANATSYLSKTVPAKLKIIRENWNLKYSACFILCPLQNEHLVPTVVSIVAKIRYSPSNFLVVVNNYNETKTTPTKLGVCVKALHFEYNKALQLLEFIELHRILGVDHFTFYNHTVGAQVGCILEDYIGRGLVTLLPWQLNMISQKEIRTEGLFAALNDCLYRSMYKYSHVILIDLDEFIIPRHKYTLRELLEWLSTKISTKTTGSFSFQNAFFYLQWGDDEWVYESNDPIATSLLTLKKTRRKTKLHPHKQRSKYICRPELVVEAGNHFIWEFIPGHGTFNVPADAAILHHYRICEFGGDDCIQTASTIDTTAFTYRPQLVSSVGRLYEQYKRQCALPELPPPPKKDFKLLKIFRNR